MLVTVAECMCVYILMWVYVAINSIKVVVVGVVNVL